MRTAVILPVVTVVSQVATAATAMPRATWPPEGSAAGGAFREMWGTILNYLPALAGALIILVIGYVVARLLSAAVTRVVSAAHLEERLSSLGLSGLAKFSSLLGLLVYSLIMIVVLVAFFDALKLPLITEPINAMITEIGAYLPKLVGGGLILLVAWVLARLLKAITIQLLKGAKLDERVCKAPEGEEKPCGAKPSETVGTIVYGLVILFALPMFFGALEIGSVVMPLQAMIEKLLTMLPNILAAAILLVLGIVLAKFVRDLVRDLIVTAKLNEAASKIGVANLSGIVGTLVYALVLIPLVIMALQALKLSVITAPAERMLVKLLEAVPQVFAAGLIVSISFVLARLVGTLVSSFLAGLGFDQMLVKLGMVPKELPENVKTPSEIGGVLAMVLIMIGAVTEAANFLGLGQISALLAALLPFAAKVLLALVMIGIGLALGRGMEKLVLSAVGGEKHWGASVAKYAVLYVTFGIALNTVGVADGVVAMAFGLPLAAMLISAAIAFGVAFGVGGRKVAADKLQEWFGKTTAGN